MKHTRQTFSDFLATAKHVDNLEEYEWAKAMEFSGKGVVFTLSDSTELYAFQPCDKVPEYWTILCNEQPQGTLEYVALELYTYAVGEGA